MEHTDVTINKEKHRFEINTGEEAAILDFKIKKNHMELIHTYVPTSARGKGLADKLAKFALEYLRKEKIKAVVYCPFIKTYLQRHKEYMDVVLKIH